MESNRALRMWQLTTILLVLCNVGLVLTLWLKPAGGNSNGNAGPGEPRRGGPRDYLVKTLKLTDEQVKQYDALIQEHRRNMQRLGEEGKGYRTAYFALMKTDTGQGTKDSLAQLVANTQKEIEVVTFNHFSDFRKILTPEQRQQFDDNTDYVMRQMQHGKPGGGERPGPPDGERGPGGPPDGGDRNGPPGDGQGPPEGEGHRPPPPGEGGQ